MNRYATALLMLPWPWLFPISIHAQEDVAKDTTTFQSRGVLVEEVRNEHPDFLVRVDVDKSTRQYNRGEEMRVTVVSAKAGYLYLIYCDAAGNVACLFPNAFGQDNKIAAGQPVVIPQPAATDKPSFRLRIGPPFGRELLKAIVSLEPLDSVAVSKLMQATTPRGQLAGVRGVYVESSMPAKDWAEHHVEIMTTDATSSDTGSTTRQPKRVGVFIGISHYLDDQIEAHLTAQHNAEAMAKSMRARGQIQQGWVLLNDQATRQNLQRVLRQNVAAVTQPGDSVFIYWSGHGAQCADDGGDEADGFDEYLVPYDGKLGTVQQLRETMLLDDTFGRWVQELDGRQVVVVLDTCHSGGQATGAKSLNVASPKSFAFSFLDDEIRRIKDIGQRNTAILSSSSSSQVSFDRDDESLGVLTHFLIKQLATGKDPILLTEAFTSLKQNVVHYVQSTNPGAVQTPQLFSNLSPDYLLRP